MVELFFSQQRVEGYEFVLAKFRLSQICNLTLSRPISLHSHKPPGPHCFEPFTCNVYRSFQPHNMHMCKQFWGKVSTAKIFYDYQTYLWFVRFFLQNEHELKIEEIFLPWKAKTHEKDCSSIDAHVAELPQLASSIDAHVVELPQRATLYYTLATRCEHILRDVTSDQCFAEIFNTTHYSIIRHRKGHCFLFRMIPLSTREGLGQKSYGSLNKAFVFVANMRPWSRKECDRPSHKCDNGLDRVKRTLYSEKNMNSLNVEYFSAMNVQNLNKNG